VKSANPDGYDEFLADICASFQASVVDVLIEKTLGAARRSSVKDIAIAGGVAANSELRRRMIAAANDLGLRVFIPKFEFCTDNGAMVAMAGYLKLKEGKTSSLELTAEPSLELT
jgi:N6-L-threonylcarbamoyladenine synthase